ncbi:MAG: hypothetical protein E6Q67_02955 [Roseateles sp.]|nr:MAG: hypothetical protein E6Q67_02955 [Roseateles sp.]
MTAQSATIASLDSTLESLEELGFGTDGPISAGDAVEVVSRAYWDVLARVEDCRRTTTSDVAEIRAHAALEMLLTAFQSVGIGDEDEDNQVDGADLIDAINEVLQDVYAAAGRDPACGSLEHSPAVPIGA